ncbi:hypothetical protein A5821_003004 [Enterococcus sp. 7F3_DIV0205]|uniref:BD-FAE-like domain-containing protein n=1 Tax=Candidatus Enterococcus palustris TaxID=1834189 RepID=A0AAQ3WC13_9ENTE|nr:alpha/beta hydrolase [Enterococcus sp. 7F3_DIV0205]OTN83438.1 hypothetical protein A5821_003361 [Enterococcus sp. 7F3_DIV0205]
MPKYVKIFILFISSVLVLTILLLFISPVPFLNVVKSRTPKLPGYTPPHNFSQLKNDSYTEKNISYNSSFTNNKYDIYIPKRKSNPPIVVFFHGGGFITGDKNMAKYFGPTLAAEGYAVISVNYELAPKATLDDQILQATDFINDLPTITDKFKLDNNNIFLSGSSAGGYLAAQLGTARYNKTYNKIDKQTIDDEIKIKGLILYSAPYKLSFIQDYPVDNWLFKLSVFEMGWALTGERFWKNDPKLGDKYNLEPYITTQFPPVFITDGNKKTFTQQAKEYEEALKKHRVDTTSLFFPDTLDVNHGYQMNMRTPESEEALSKTLSFLDKWTQ